MCCYAKKVSALEGVLVGVFLELPIIDTLWRLLWISSVEVIPVL